MVLYLLQKKVCQSRMQVTSSLISVALMLFWQNARI
nr:MAG TPA_asm: hypothetical protein [Caudoviricetes sp.]